MRVRVQGCWRGMVLYAGAEFCKLSICKELSPDDVGRYRGWAWCPGAASVADMVLWCWECCRLSID